MTHAQKRALAMFLTLPVVALLRSQQNPLRLSRANST